MIPLIVGATWRGLRLTQAHNIRSQRLRLSDKSPRSLAELQLPYPQCAVDKPGCEESAEWNVVTQAAASSNRRVGAGRWDIRAVNDATISSPTGIQSGVGPG